jgi:O-antigen ligase
MLDVKAKKLLSFGLMSTVALTTLLILPYSSWDPVSLPKMCFVVFAGPVLFGLWAPSLKKIIAQGYGGILVLSTLLILQMLLVFVFSGTSLWLQMYGTFGRSTGLFTYIALTLLMMSSAVASSSQFISRFIMLPISLGVILVVYGQVQHQGWDPFLFVNAYGSNVFGTLGNPNFMSAFMGMIGALAFTMMLNKSLSLRVRIVLSALTMASIVIIYQTKSVQGYLNLATGIIVTGLLWLFMSKKKTFAILASGLAGAGGALIFLGLVNMGPLSDSLYKSSLAARGYYWRAGIKMLFDHPFFGVGMDGYGEWYRRSRNLEDTLVNPGIHSDAAHNIFLDFASSGGFPLILIYLAILGLVILSVIRVVRRNNGFNPYFVALVAAWVAYQAQSFISINQIGLAIWGWVLSGLIIGFEINTRTDNASELSPGTGSRLFGQKKLGQSLSPSTVVSVFTAVLIGALVAVPPYVAANKYYKALKSGDALVLQPATYAKPYDRVRFTFSASNFAQNGLNDRALVVIRDGVKLFPNSYEAWSVLAGLPNASAAEITQAKAEMKRLDPFNPDLK